MVTQLGPIQLVLINLGPNDSFDAEIVMELIEVSQDGQGIIRLIDALLLRHDKGGALSFIQVTDLSDSKIAEFGPLISKLIGWGAREATVPEAKGLLGKLAVAENDFGLSEEQLYAITEDVSPGTAALILLFEHTWAKNLKAAVRKAGGVMVAQGLIGPEALLKAGPELAKAMEVAAGPIEEQYAGQLQRDTSAHYRIRLQGKLDQSWSEYLDGMTITVAQMADGAPVTVLTGQLVDQAALVGVLNNVYDLGFSLLSVEYLGVA